MRLRDAFSALYSDADFAAFYPARGQPGLAPWRLALVTVFQFLEQLSDRQAADAVRAGIDWKYALGLELTDPGFHFSVLAEFRAQVRTKIECPSRRIDVRKLLLIPLLIGVQAAVAQSNPLPPTAVTVSLSNFSFTPETIHLEAGVPVVLRLENRSNGGHNFSAPQFFAAAKLDPTSASLVQRGTIEIPGGGVRDVAVIPATGRYPLKCTHTFHSMFGMKGTIVVD